MIVLKRIVIALAVSFVAAVFGLFAWNFYLRYTAGDQPPPVIYERSDRPSRA